MNKLIFILAEGFKNVWRHKSSAVSSIFSIYFTLIVSGSLLIVSQNTNKLIEYLRDKYKIEVFFKDGVTEENKLCYKATCFETAKLLAKRFNLDKKDYTVGFQSRLGRGWIEPFSDEIIENLAKQGAKKLLVFSPAFVADCLETTIEIGDEYNELFQEHGGEKVQLVESLNSSDTFVKGLKDMVLKRSV